jgi:hypothetical protein
MDQTYRIEAKSAEINLRKPVSLFFSLDNTVIAGFWRDVSNHYGSFLLYWKKL